MKALVTRHVPCGSKHHDFLKRTPLLLSHLSRHAHLHLLRHLRLVWLGRLHGGHLERLLLEARLHHRWLHCLLPGEMHRLLRARLRWYLVRELLLLLLLLSRREESQHQLSLEKSLHPPFHQEARHPSQPPREKLNQSVAPLHT